MAKIDPIDRAEMIEALEFSKTIKHMQDNVPLIDEFIGILNDAPSLDVQPVRRGEWRVTEAWPHKVYCTNCYVTIGVSTVPGDVEAKCVPRTNFCHECGADMRGERLDGDDT